VARRLESQDEAGAHANERRLGGRFVVRLDEITEIPDVNAEAEAMRDKAEDASTGIQGKVIAFRVEDI
jgi:hypothetical protein